MPALDLFVGPDYVVTIPNLPLQPVEYLFERCRANAHGTTLAGLMAEHGVDPHDFLDFVHDIDLARLAADPALVAALDRLPGRKFVFTNASEDYARRVLDRLGLANAFDGMHDIHAMAYVPKPDPSGYAAICERHGIDPGARPVRRRHGPQPRARPRRSA